MFPSHPVVNLTSVSNEPLPAVSDGFAAFSRLLPLFPAVHLHVASIRTGLYIQNSAELMSVFIHVASVLFSIEMMDEGD